MWLDAPDNSTKIDLTAVGARYVRIIHCQGSAELMILTPWIPENKIVFSQ